MGNEGERDSTPLRQHLIQFDLQSTDAISRDNDLTMPTLANLDDLTHRRLSRVRVPTSKAQESTDPAVKAMIQCINTALTSFLDFVPVYLPNEELKSNFSNGNLHDISTSTMMINYDGVTPNVSLYVLMANQEHNDVFTYGKMLREHDNKHFITAMKKEIDDHTKRKHWTIVRRSELDHFPKVIPAIWSFKCKRKPDGEITSYNARLCAYGGLQQWGENCWTCNDISHPACVIYCFYPHH